MWLEVSKSHFEAKRLQRRPEIRTMRPLQIRCLVRRTIFWGNITEPKNTLSGHSMARRPCDGSMQASTCSICGAGGFSFLLVHTGLPAISIDDLDQIEKTLSKLEITAETHSLEPYRAIALGLRGRYLIRLSRVAEGIQLLRGSLQELKNRRYGMLVTDFVSELAVSLAKQNARAEAVAL